MQRTADVVEHPLVHDHHRLGAAGPERVDHGLDVLLVHDQVVRIDAGRVVAVGIPRRVGQRHPQCRGRAPRSVRRPAPARPPAPDRRDLRRHGLSAAAASICVCRPAAPCRRALTRSWASGDQHRQVADAVADVLAAGVRPRGAQQHAREQARTTTAEPPPGGAPQRRPSSNSHSRATPPSCRSSLPRMAVSPVAPDAHRPPTEPGRRHNVVTSMMPTP